VYEDEDEDEDDEDDDVPLSVRQFSVTKKMKSYLDR
jgi:hypothetical protein